MHSMHSSKTQKRISMIWLCYRSSIPKSIFFKLILKFSFFSWLHILCLLTKRNLKGTGWWKKYDGKKCSMLLQSLAKCLHFLGNLVHSWWNAILFQASTNVFVGVAKLVIEIIWGETIFLCFCKQTQSLSGSTIRLWEACAHYSYCI